MVGRHFRVNITADKEKAIKEPKTGNSPSRKHSVNCSNRQYEESAKSVLMVSSDTPSNMINGLHKQCLNHPTNIIIGHLNFNFMGINCQSYVPNETDICWSSKLKFMTHFQTPNFWQKTTEYFEKIDKKMVASLFYL